MTADTRRDTALAYFFQNAEQNKAANAYLLTGPKEAVLNEHARTFLLRLFCENKTGCGQCRACKKVSTHNFLDIAYIGPDGQHIKIGAIRSLNEFLVKRPQEGDHRAIVISRAELMTPQAQNCLLKPLEEPPAQTVFILLARSLGGMLPTVVSRCRVVKLVPQDKGRRGGQDQRRIRRIDASGGTGRVVVGRIYKRSKKTVQRRSPFSSAVPGIFPAG